MEERIFWLNRNQSGLYESGYPLNLDQLFEEFEDTEYFDVNAFLAGDTKEVTWGAFQGDDTFSIFEVSSLDELRDLMTWKAFDPEESHASGVLGFDYPDFVHDELRLSRYIYEFTGYTAYHLPVSCATNTTVRKYAEAFGLTRKVHWITDLCYKPTDEDRAKKLIADVLNNVGSLSVDEYNRILVQYGLSDYVTKGAKPYAEEQK